MHQQQYPVPDDIPDRRLSDDNILILNNTNDHNNGIITIAGEKKKNTHTLTGDHLERDTLAEVSRTRSRISSSLGPDRELHKSPRIPWS